VHGALVFLIVRSFRNSVRARLRRLKQPRYLAVAVGVVLYFGSMSFSRSHGGGFSIPPAYERTAQVALGIGVATLMAIAWLLPASASLRVSLPEVHFLFTAPVTRREFLTYKVVRLLSGVAGTGVFITLVAGPLRPLAGLVFLIKTTAIAALLALHEAGVSLYRQNQKDKGALAGARRLRVLAAAFTLIAVSALITARFSLAKGGELLLLLPILLALIAAEFVWLLRSDAAFEEEAALLAEKAKAQLARVERRQPRLTANRTARFALAARGPVETAILWKNWLLLTRGSSTQWIGSAAVLLMFVVVFLVGFGTAADDPVAPILGFVIAGIVVLFGPATLRLDLRHDLANLPLIKTWPVRGAAIVRGEVLAPAIALSIAAVAGILISAAFAPVGVLPSPSPIGRLNFALCASAVACALIVAQLVIQNGIAVIFPAWIRITPPTSGGAGVEIMGQSLVVMYGGMLLLGVASIVPGAVAALLLFTAGGIAAPAMSFTLLLLIESYAAIEILGAAFDRLDLKDVTVAE
jgi:hypothetical protein